MVTLEHPATQVNSQKSQVSNTETLIFFPFYKSNVTTTLVTLIIIITVMYVFLSGPVGYSSNHSSLTDLSHRRSASGGSASTGISSIMEPSDHQGESRITPPISATYHHTPDHFSTPSKVPR